MTEVEKHGAYCKFSKSLGIKPLAINNPLWALHNEILVSNYGPVGDGGWMI